MADGAMKTMTVSMKLNTKQYKDGMEETVQQTKQFQVVTSKSLKEVAEDYSKMGTNIKVTEKAGAQFTSTQRKQNKEVKQAAKYIEELTAEYAAAAAQVDMTEDQIKEMNAALMLGKGATQAQIKEVVRLETALTKMGRTGAISMRQVRHGAQMASYQVQDVAVQAAMGTDAMVIMGQQGSQILSIFGMWGAAAGGVVAIAAAIYQMGGAAETTAQMIERLTVGTEMLTEKQRELIGLSYAEDIKKMQKEYDKSVKTVADYATKIEEAAKGTLIQRSAVAELTKKHLEASAASETLNLKLKELNGTVKEFDSSGENWQETFGGIDDISYEVKVYSDAMKAAATETKRLKAIEDTRQATVDRMLASLKEENELFGKTKQAVTLYRLELAGATQEELNFARSQAEAIATKTEAEASFQALMAGDQSSKASKEMQKNWVAEQAIIAGTSRMYTMLGNNMANYGGTVGILGNTLLNYHRIMTIAASTDAIAQAWSSAPFPYNMGAVAAATVETGALQATMDGLGQFDDGGLIGAGKRGIVSEWGDEQINKRGNGGGTMVVNDSKESVSVKGRRQTAQEGGGGGAVIYQTFKYTSVDSAGMQELLMNNKEAVYNATSKAMNDRGKKL